uniref:Uncharacterized protein n=1 Tax=Romanomermis culicivorax TaxID=13658 RepID=A0A915IDL0_ROMCU
MQCGHELPIHKWARQGIRAARLAGAAFRAVRTFGCIVRVKIDSELLESRIAVFFFFEPFERLVIGAKDNLLTIYVVAINLETVDNGEAFALHCTVSRLCVGEQAAAVGDNLLIIAVFLVQNCSHGGLTGVSLYDELSFAILHWVTEERRGG